MGWLVFALCLTMSPINATFLSLWAEITPPFHDLSEMLPRSGAIFPIPSAQGYLPLCPSVCLSLSVSLSVPLCVSVSQWGFHGNFIVFPLRHFSLSWLLLYLLTEKTLFSLDFPWMWKNTLVIFCTPRNPSPPCIWSISWLPSTCF